MRKTFKKPINNQDDVLGIFLFSVLHDRVVPGPEDEDFDDDDDDDFDVETGDDIEEIDEEIEEDWDEDELIDDDDETVTNKKTTEGDALEAGNLDTDFEDRPYTTRRTSGRMIDHEPGTSGFDPPL